MLAGRPAGRAGRGTAGSGLRAGSWRWSWPSRWCCWGWSRRGSSADWQWVSLALASPVAVWGAWPFHRAALASARHGAATMDTLISVGVTAAYLWSLYALVSGGERLTDVPGGRAPGVTALVLLGRWLEARARRRSGAALRALLSLGAKDVAVLRDGAEVRIPAAELAVGDEFAVRPGETIAADGVVIAGRSAVDTSMLTGEPAPAEVGPGDPVTGGCVNAGGHLVVRARPGRRGHPAGPAGAAGRAGPGGQGAGAAAGRPDLAVFVPVVIGIAVATLTGWLAAGAGAGAAVHRRGRRADHRLPVRDGPGHADRDADRNRAGGAARHRDQGPGGARVDPRRRHRRAGQDRHRHHRADEPGRGAPRRPGQDADELLRLAGAVEDASEHPIGAAVAAGARERFGGLPAVRGVRQRPGPGGFRVSWTGAVVVAGRAGWLSSAWGWPVPDGLAARAAAAEAAGRTVVFAGWDGAVRGALVVADTVKPTSAEAVRPAARAWDCPGAAHRRQRARRPVAWPRRSASAR